MTDIGRRIKIKRDALGMSQEELAKRLGYKNKSSIAKIETGINDITQSKVVEFAEVLKTSVAFLMGWDEPEQSSIDELSKYGIKPIATQRIPFLGEIACGEPIYADEDRESYIEVGTEIKADFCLRAKGDSMINARIFDGDIVFIRKQDMVDNGEIAVVLIENEATLKRVYYDRDNNILRLVAENPKCKPFVYVGEELNQIRILGKAVAFQSDVV